MQACLHDRTRLTDRLTHYLSHGAKERHRWRRLTARLGSRIVEQNEKSTHPRRRPGPALEDVVEKRQLLLGDRSRKIITACSKTRGPVMGPGPLPWPSPPIFHPLMKNSLRDRLRSAGETARGVLQNRFQSAGRR